MDNLTALENWAAPLLAKLTPQEVRRIGIDVARDLRRSQAQRIATQQAPDGTPYAPRKPQVQRRGARDARGPRGTGGTQSGTRGMQPGKLRAQQGKVRASMFNKLRSARHLRADATPTEALVGFVGRAAYIARVHQEGLRDAVKPSGVMYTYPARPVLGLTDAERARIADRLVVHLTGG